jgi:hypothetical protein
MSLLRLLRSLLRSRRAESTRPRPGPRLPSPPSSIPDIDPELLAAVADVDIARLRLNLALAPLERLAAVTNTLRWASSDRREPPT